ncbi:response regulator transcription factor [Flavisolibacter sp. BT320]|nr:response regulator transcription factor [Flavisolibacter longurius]
MIQALIIDDEKHSCEALQLLLQDNCPQVEVVGIAYAGEEALVQIQRLKPQLIFLDIEMPHMTGFQLLERLPVIDFEVIFTTSYDQYAIRAFKFSALDYLLKPVDREELESAVQKVVQKVSAKIPEQLNILLQKLQQPAAVQRIALPTMQGLELVPIQEIIHCSSQSNYTAFQLKENRCLLVSRTLKEVEEMLSDHAFLRVHHSHLVNLNEVIRYVKGEGGYLVMTDGSTIDVSRGRKEVLLHRLGIVKS